jgi:hypothetical protein
MDLTSIRLNLYPISFTLVAVVMLFSGIEHFRNPWHFLRTIYQYRYGESLGLIVAMTIPSIQFCGSAMLVLKRTRFIGALVMFLLLVAFTWLQLHTVYRGLAIECGCFGVFSDHVSFKSLGLNGAILVIIVWVLFAEYPGTFRGVSHE